MAIIWLYSSYLILATGFLVQTNVLILNHFLPTLTLELVEVDFVPHALLRSFAMELKNVQRWSQKENS